MEYVTLGKTGLKISRLGFGGIPIQRIGAEEAKELMAAGTLVKRTEKGKNYYAVA